MIEKIAAAGFSHTDSHTDARLLRNLPDAECESRMQKWQDESGNGVLSSGHHDRCVSDLDEIIERDGWQD